MKSTIFGTDGNVIVQKRKYPHLYRATLRGLELKKAVESKWARVKELRDKGEEAAAERLERKLLGVKPKKKMTEERKAERARYNKEHKEEISQRRKEKREERRRRLEAVRRATEQLNRKKR